MEPKCEAKHRRNKRQQSSTTQIENLPREILLLIVSKLPLSSLLRFKCVCKAWHNLSRDPHLLRIRENRSLEENQCLIFHSYHPIKNQLSFIEFGAIYKDTFENSKVRKFQTPFCDSVPEFEVVSSCNGLLCLSDSINNTLFIYNPFTSDYMELPKTTHYPNLYTVVFGFGSIPLTNEYKVVKVVYYWNKPQRRFNHASLPLSEVQSLSLGSSSWKSLGKAPKYLDKRPAEVLLHGRFHWHTLLYRNSRSRSIVSFDIAEERFRDVPVPMELVIGTRCSVSSLRGCLSVVTNHRKIEIWVMKEYDVKESWVKEFSIRSYVPMGLRDHEQVLQVYGSKKGRFDRVLCVLSNGEILFECRFRALVLYNPDTDSFKDVNFRGLPNFFETVVHVVDFNQMSDLVGFVIC